MIRRFISFCSIALGLPSSLLRSLVCVCASTHYAIVSSVSYVYMWYVKSEIMETCFHNYWTTLCIVCVRFNNNLIIALNRLFGSNFQFVLLFRVVFFNYRNHGARWTKPSVSLVFWLQIVHTHFFSSIEFGFNACSSRVHFCNLFKWLDIMDRQ